MKKEKEKKSKKKSKALYIIGSIALTVGSVIVVPKFIDYSSSYIYAKKPQNTLNHDDNEWGPEIVKKSEE